MSSNRMSREQRSHTMSLIRSENTGPEMELRRTLRLHGIFGYRIHPKYVPGSPDVAFMRKKVAVFVDGCFWHHCPQCYREPKSNVEFWSSKIRRNVERDRRVDAKLTEGGWFVLRIWEHEVRNDPVAVALRVCRILGRSVQKAGK